MKKNKPYFTTGEFAKIFDINKQTLFYYDQCGIFRPDVVGENGYRYYSFTQLEAFAMIVMLRSLDLPIAEIKAVINKKSPSELIGLLKGKIDDIDDKIQELTWSKQYIQKKINSTLEGINAPIGQVIFENSPVEYCIVSDYRGNNNEKEVIEAAGEHFAFCQRIGLHSAYPIGALIPVSSVSENGYSYSNFYTTVLSEELNLINESGLASDLLDKGGNYIAIYDNQGYSNILSNCLKLLDFAEGHNLTPGPHFFEDVILDDLTTDGYYNYLVKLSIKVK